jgi:hypothetical protein
MQIAILFWAFFVSSIALIVWHGDFFARFFAAFLVSMTCLTFFVNIMLGMEAAWKWVTLIHVAIFIVAMFGAVTSKYFWPIWFAGFQFNSVGAAMAQLFDGQDYLRFYAYTASLWAFPALCVTVIGVMRDSKARRLNDEQSSR